MRKNFPRLACLAALSLAQAPLAALPDDTCATAVPAVVTPGGALIYSNRTLDPADLVDHYRVTVGPGVEAILEAVFSHADGDLDLRLWNSDCTLVLDTSTTQTDDEFVTWVNTTGAPAEVVCEVYASALTNVVDYAMIFSGVQASCNFDDQWEENDTCATAALLPFGAQNLTVHTITPSDPDYFRIDLPPGTEVRVSVNYNLAEGNIDAELIDADCVTVLASSTTMEDEQLLMSNPTQQVRTLYLHVYRADGGSCSLYGLWTLAQPGMNYCAAVPNTTGSAAQLTAYGSASVSADGLWLSMSPIPMDQFGLFIYGADRAATPLGLAVLCVGSGFVRSPVQQGLYQTLDWQVDYSLLAGSSLPIQPGNTYHFQGWFRDPMQSNVTFGLTDGYSITFLP